MPVCADGLVMLQPDMLASERKGERCISYSFDGDSAASDEDGSAAVTAGQSCKATLLTSADYVESLEATFGELPGLLVGLVIVDVLGRRPTLAYFAGVTCLVFVAVIPCTSQSFETLMFGE
eukprot:SAG31_NODE_7886_length_1573_cov_1.398915_2_plen_121_part_00